MKITKITISNFLKLKDVEINPSHTNVIVGKNKQGKTSILKAIRMAFDGKADATSIRIGESKAEITVELDELTVKRTLTEKGNYLDISNKEGMKMPAPQKYLDGILGTFSFNPIEFFDKKPVERKKYLLNAIKLNITQDQLAEYTGEPLIGLDYEGSHALEIVEQARKWYYDKRTIANAEVSKKEKSLADLNSQIPEGFDAKTVSEEEISRLRDAITKDEQEKIKADAQAEKVTALQKRETELKAELEEVQKSIVEALSVTFDFSDDMALQAAKDTLTALESKRELAFTVKRAEEVRGELSVAIQEADKLDTVVKRLSKEIPEALIATASLPVEGLTISGDDILVNGVNIDNLSSSEQLKFGLEVVRALNGDFKIICIDGIESLDKDSFEFFLKEIENDDYQYFVTRVEGNSPHSLVVEDGEVTQQP
jgi:predicted ATP-dependent endonuclease of OLD family